MAQRFKSTTFLLSFLSVVAMTGHATNIYDWLRVFDPLTGGLIFSATGDGIYSETVSATDTVSAATFSFQPSGVPVLVPEISPADTGKALIYDATSNQIYLQSITDSLDYEGIGASLSVGMLNDVSVEYAQEGWGLGYFGGIWEATPMMGGAGGITTEQMEAAIASATDHLTLDELDNVNVSGKADGEILYWNAGAGVWDATPQVSGSGGGTAFDPSTLRIPYIVSVTYLGSPAAGAKMLYHAVPREVTFTAGLSSSQAICETAATVSAVFSIRKNNTEFGTATFAIGSTTGTFAAASGTTFTTGDILTIVAPDPADDTLAQIGITLLGEQGVIAE